MAGLLASLATVNDQCHIMLDLGITQFMANEALEKVLVCLHQDVQYAPNIWISCHKIHVGG